MADIDDALLETIRSLAATTGFRASYLASATGVDVGRVHDQLNKLVEAGDLEPQFELLCPGTGRLIRRYTAGEHLPIGETVAETDDCEEFVATRRSFWVTYRPTRQGLVRLAQRGDPPGKASARPRRLRQVLRALRTDSIKPHLR